MKNFSLRTLFILFTLAAPWLAHAYSSEIGDGLWGPQAYRPSYLLYGSQNTKVQLSFKEQLLENNELYFGYSQLMFWKIGHSSAPFQDLNYNPELFYRQHINGDAFTWIDFGFFEHESNGKDQADSRSWDRSYILYSTYVDLENKRKLTWSLKAWIPYDLDDTNPDITYYRGFWEGNVTLSNFMGGSFDRNALTLRFYPGGPSGMDPLKGGQELTFRTTIAGTTKFLPVVYLQVFNGYGEGMLDYNKNYTAFRLGVGFN